MTWACTILVLDLTSILTILMKEKLDPIKDLFPYDAFRPSQDRFIRECHESLDKPRHVVISAPNGFGKTVSTLCAAIPVALENDLKIVYCCRTHTQNSRVIMELNKIFEKLDKEGKDLKSLYHLGGVSLRSRTDMCFMDQVRKANLNPSDASIVCGQLRADNRCKFFRNMKWALGKDDLHLPVSTNSSFDAGDIKDYCSMKNYCPYFYSRELQKKVLVIVANYNWVFDPDIQERFLDVINVPLEEILLIVDEAHNLPPLAERIYSRKLGDYTISAATRELGEYFHRDSDKDELKSFLRLIQDLFNEYEDRIGNQDEMDLDGRKIIQDIQHGLSQDLGILLHHLDETGKEIQKEKLASGKRNPRSFCRAVAKFWTEWNLYTLDKASYYHCFSLNRDSATLRHNFESVCLDPGLTGIQHVMDRVFASVSLSGTIIPNVYSTQCRINQPVTIELPSPFKENHVKAFILDGVSTAFKDRDESMYAKYVGKILEMAMATPKNSAAFCASYRVLEGIEKAGFKEAIRSIGKFPLIEKRSMSSSDNDQLVEQYKEYSRISDGAVLLGVCGGRNSEGQDFPGDEMNAVMICGIPYASPTNRLKKKIDYYDSIIEGNSSSGRILAYMIPAIMRANQACGRPIRTLQDHAAIILADYRFKSRRIAKLLSSWILKNIVAIRDKRGLLQASIRNFYQTR